MQAEAIGGAAPVSAASPANTTGANAAAQTATSAFGLSFESLLKIILTQLTYQDPLKPMENFEFVSQLAQFSQVQQGQVISDRLLQLVNTQASVQTTSLLGKTVDIIEANSVLTGIVKAISFRDGDARLTVDTADGQTISDLSLTAVSQVREGN